MSDKITNNVLVCDGLYKVTGKEIGRVVNDTKTIERQRCIELIRSQARVYLPGYIMDKLIQDIEKGE